MEEHYQYRPLVTDSRTRIFDLESATEFHAPLVGALREVEIKDAAGTYEALSYVWGSKGKPGAVPLDGKYGALSPVGEPRGKPGAVLLDGKYLAITENCTAALQYLRLPSKRRTLWVDSICINQENIAERNKQVQQMGGIFQKAAQTLLWLGKPVIGTSIAIYYLGELNARYHNPNREETADWYRKISSNVSGKLHVARQPLKPDT